MGDGPRRRRAKVWAWVYLAFFGDDDEPTDAETELTDPAEESTQEMSEGPETR